MTRIATFLTAGTLPASPAFAQMLDLEKDELTFGFIKLTDMARSRSPRSRATSSTRVCSSRSRRRRTGRCCSTA